LPESRILYGTLAELPQITASLGAGPAVIILGEVLREALASRSGFESLRQLLRA